MTDRTAPTGEPSTRLAEVRRLVEEHVAAVLDSTFLADVAGHRDLTTGPALDAALVTVCAERDANVKCADAWRDYAGHMEWCRSCAEDGVGSCSEGTELRIAADAVDAARAAHTATPAERCPTCYAVTRTILASAKTACPDAWHDAATPAPAASEESWWLIENVSVPHHTRYYTGNERLDRGMHLDRWSDDVNDARRYRTKEEGERALKHLPRAASATVRVAEHIWTDAGRHGAATPPAKEGTR